MPSASLTRNSYTPAAMVGIGRAAGIPIFTPRWRSNNNSPMSLLTAFENPFMTSLARL